jgi:hypothetical protein
MLTQESPQRNRDEAPAEGTIFPEPGEGGPSGAKCSILCDRDPAKWSLGVSQKQPNGRLKFRESWSGAPGNCVK